MKKKLYYLLLLAVLASACNSKENNEDLIDPNDPKEKILGDWVQHKSVLYREGSSFKDTNINKYLPPHYYRFTREQYINGYPQNGVVVFQDYGNIYQIKGDSIFQPFWGKMTFAGDSLKIELRYIQVGVKHLLLEVLYRYHP